MAAFETGVLDEYAVVYFGNDWFAENRTSSHHIARRLAQRLPLLYVDSPGLRAPAPTARDLRRLVRKLRETMRGPRRLGEHFWHCTVPQIPLRKLPLAAALNRGFGAFALRRVIRRLGFRRLLLWFTVPHPWFLADRLGADYVVYYCTDDYAAHPGVDREAVAEMDQRLTRRADQVFVASLPLLAAKQELNPSVRFSPHGVDVDLFARPSDPATPIPGEAAGLPHPVIGFFGVVGAWVDLDLLAFLGASRPRWTFLMVGRVAVNVDRLRSLGNFMFPGPQPYESLPGWAKVFDVAIIPYLQNPQVMSANPLKLREYLATGKPIVSVSTPEVDRFAPLVQVARNYEDFLAKIELALTQDSETDRRARQSSVAGMSWEARVSEVLQIVAANLVARRARRSG